MGSDEIKSDRLGSGEIIRDHMRFIQMVSYMTVDFKKITVMGFFLYP